MKIKVIVNDNYRDYRAVYPFKLLLRALTTRDPVKRQSLLNRQRDYLGLAGKPQLMAFHAVVDELLQQANRDWNAYDYGQSYFYQGCRSLGLSGLRDTEARIEALGLRQLVAGRSVFEVGVNVGFLSAELAASARAVTGIEINPHCVEIAKRAMDYLELTNLRIITGGFEEYETDERYEVLLSLANHSTIDGLTAHRLEDYFAKCRGLIESGGLMVFESHPQGFEHKSLDHTFEVLSRYFTVDEKYEPHYGNPLDQGRTVALARPIPDP